jgi:peptidyl-prolyl cis-trans isomerase B (cyclophilin B)
MTNDPSGEQPPQYPWGHEPGNQPPPYGAGYSPASGVSYPQPRGTNGFAIASLVCAFLCSPLGLIFGFIARSQIRQTSEAGDGLALAGIIISLVFIVFTVIVWIGFFAAVRTGHSF